MKFLNNTKKTRFKLALVLEVFLGSVVITAIHYDMSDVANAALAGVLSVGSAYLLSDGYRKSIK